MCEKTINDFTGFQNKPTHMTFTLCLGAFLADQRDLVANLHFLQRKTRCDNCLARSKQPA